MIPRFLASPLVVRYEQSSRTIARLSFLVEQDGLLLEQLVARIHTPEWLAGFIGEWVLNGGEVIDLRHRTDRLTSEEIQEFVVQDSFVHKQAARNRRIAQKRQQSMEEEQMIEA